MRNICTKLSYCFSLLTFLSSIVSCTPVPAINPPPSISGMTELSSTSTSSTKSSPSPFTSGMSELSSTSTTKTAPPPAPVAKPSPPPPLVIKNPQKSDLSTQFKLTFSPDGANTYLTNNEISELFENAKAVGLELGYRMLSLDKERGNIFFIQNEVNGSYSKKINILVDVSPDKKRAYVYISISGSSKLIIDQEMNTFKQNYKRKFH